MISKRPGNHPPLPETPEDYQEESGGAYVALSKAEIGDYAGKPFIEANGVPYVLLTGAQAMALRGIPQLELTAKEGLAFNNGTTFSTALATLALHDAENLARHAELAAAMSLEALLGFRDAFLPHIQQVRGHQGQIEVAQRILKIVGGSTIMDGDEDLDPRFVPPQDAYSLRVTPQVLGAIQDALAFIRSTVSTEINAATDNPMIFDLPQDHPLYLPRDYKAVSGGNFHGAPIAYAMDLLGILVTDLGSLSERRVFRMLDKNLNHALPAFLMRDAKPGVTSGMMIPQYLAASLVSDCKTLAHPDSVDSIPTSANQEDHVSMSMNAARHARKIVDNIGTVVSVELLCASLALHWRLRQVEEQLADADYKPEEKIPYKRDRFDEIVLCIRATGQAPTEGQGTRLARELIEAHLYEGEQGLPELRLRTAEDRYLRPYILRVKALLENGELVEQVYEKVDLS